MEVNTTNAFFKLIKLSDKDTNKAFTIALIVALGFVVWVVVGKLENVYVAEHKQDLLRIEKVEQERDKYKSELMKVYKEKYYESPTVKADSIITNVNKLIDKLDKK